jgi:hypothetical protein
MFASLVLRNVVRRSPEEVFNGFLKSISASPHHLDLGIVPPPAKCKALRQIYFSDDELRGTLTRTEMDKDLDEPSTGTMRWYDMKEAEIKKESRLMFKNYCNSWNQWNMSPGLATPLDFGSLRMTPEMDRVMTEMKKHYLSRQLFGHPSLNFEICKIDATLMVPTVCRSQFTQSSQSGKTKEEMEALYSSANDDDGEGEEEENRRVICLPLVFRVQERIAGSDGSPAIVPKPCKELVQLHSFLMNTGYPWAYNKPRTLKWKWNNIHIWILGAPWNPRGKERKLYAQRGEGKEKIPAELREAKGGMDQFTLWNINHINPLGW